MLIFFDRTSWNSKEYFLHHKNLEISTEIRGKKSFCFQLQKSRRRKNFVPLQWFFWIYTHFVGRSYRKSWRHMLNHKIQKHPPENNFFPTGEISKKFMSRTLAFLFNFFHFENIKKVFKGLVFLFSLWKKDLPFNVRQETEGRCNVIQIGERNVFMV